MFGADSSADPDGDALTFAWSFGDGGTLVTSADTAVHIYRDNGAYTARLIVKDARGAADTATARVSVANVAPDISISKFPEPVLPVGMVFEAEVVFWEVGTDDVLQGGISWGDGTSTALASSGATVTHSYSSIGTYSINVWVRDKDGATTARLGPQMKIFDGYDVIDLGTLGGASARAYALNDNGRVVGTSQTASGEWHAFVWENGVMRDLGLPYSSSKAQAITNSGVISGVGAQAEAAYTHVFRWEAGSVEDLGTVYAFNGDDAHVVGMTARDVLATYETSMSRFYSTLWRNSAKQNLGGLESPNSTALATAMNSQGQIVGASLLAGPAVRDVYHAFMWQNGAIRDLGVLAHFECSETPGRDCGDAWATDVNSSGDVVGQSADSFHAAHAVLWPGNGGPIRDLGAGWRPVAINEGAEVAGYDVSGGVFWRQGVATRLESLNGQMVVTDLNDLSMVIGTSQGDYLRRHVFVWQPGQAHLKDLGTGGMTHEAIAVAINARGDIIGNACVIGSIAYCPEEIAPSRAILWRAKP